MKQDIKLNYKIIGQGEPIVVLHGLFGMLDNLQIFAKKIADQERMIYLVDQRDHGRSPHTQDFSYSLLSSDLSKFMEDNWLHQTDLIGHSMGGKTALQFVVDHPGIVKKLVIIDIGIKQYSSGHDEIFDALLSIPLNIVTSREEVFNLLIEKIGDENTVHFLMKNLSRVKDGVGFEWKMNLPLLKEKYDNILAGIQVSEIQDIDVLFVRGEKSNYILDKDVMDILEFFPKAKFVTIPNAGHWVHVENLEKLVEEINDFLKT